MVPFRIVTCHEVTECPAPLPFKQAPIAEPDQGDEDLVASNDDIV